ncbi:MAG: hypothetical protein JO043_08765 [Candidatus Eremiobacteraeota bacterium]|nr:hypothetical protein [Candidatus Eremiobacteraeota bacterium]
MTDRFVAFATAVVAVALVAAQIIAPAWAFVHSEPYALALAVAVWVLLTYALRASRGADGNRGRRLAYAAGGAALIALAGIASGLMGPDLQTLVRAPGTVLPLPDVHAAAFFPLVDADGIARGDTSVVIRRRGRAEIAIAPNRRRLLGTALLLAEPGAAAYIEARDESGQRLTITQPTNPAFLSPVLQFGTSVAIDNQQLPADEFAIPALHRRVTAIFIDAKAASAIHASRLGDQNVVLFSVRDDASHNVAHGIGFAPSGGDAEVGGLRLHVTIGTYPRLVVASAPLPIALWFGGAGIVLGLVFAWAWPAAVPHGVVLSASREGRA